MALVEKLPSWSLSLYARRKAVGKSQLDIETETNGEVYQKLVSRIENGELNPRELSLGKMLGYATSLEWTLQEFCESAEVDTFGLFDQTNLRRENYLELPVQSMTARGSNLLPTLIQPLPISDEGVNPFVHIYLVETHSMEPRILFGQRVIVHATKEAKKPVEGAVYMFDDGEKYDLARAREVEGRFLLIPDNPAYKTVPWTSTTIVGRATKRVTEEDL